MQTGIAIWPFEGPSACVTFAQMSEHPVDEGDWLELELEPELERRLLIIPITPLMGLAVTPAAKRAMTTAWKRIFFKKKIFGLLLHKN